MIIHHTICVLFIPLGYIDPGTGSLLLQLLLGGLASAWVILKLFGKRIGTKLGLIKKEPETNNSGPAST
jgi:hypothetical protein